MSSSSDESCGNSLTENEVAQEGLKKGKKMTYIINFGKYSGKLIGNVKRGYLNWCLERIEDGEFKFMSEEEKTELEEAIEKELEIRDRSHITF